MKMMKNGCVQETQQLSERSVIL